MNKLARNRSDGNKGNHKSKFDDLKDKVIGEEKEEEEFALVQHQNHFFVFVFVLKIVKVIYTFGYLLTIRYTNKLELLIYFNAKLISLGSCECVHMGIVSSVLISKPTLSADVFSELFSYIFLSKAFQKSIISFCDSTFYSANIQRALIWSTKICMVKKLLPVYLRFLLILFILTCCCLYIAI